MTEIQRRRVRPVIGPGLRTLLAAVLLVVALMVINSAYLALVTLLEWRTGQIVQNQMYQYMFLFHLVVGLLLIVPLVIFMGVHARNAWHRPNRRAVYAGLSLMACVLVLLISGLLLIRFDFFEINRPWMRNVVYWMHVLVPLAIAWLFILHRLAGPAIRWRSGLKLAGAGASFVVVLIVWQSQDLTATDQPGVVGEVDFMPALVRTADGQRIDGEVLMNDQYCQTCHADSHAQWSESVHRFASFNNPVYRFAVENTREKIFERDGNMDAARFCAACHDVVPLLTGRFDDPHFDCLNDPTGQAGITCTTCHAVSHINSPRGNGDFTITEPVHYPFAFSENSALQWVNAQLIKANPAFHKKTFLKPLHQSPEFCGSCHKVHIPEVLNDYKWLRGQNHYDSFLLSGVSGHGVTSFYYPPQA
ncbi:MAG: multiheme c-type cytochrome, partial [Pseudomonadota bacterium]